jgi:transposase
MSMIGNIRRMYFREKKSEREIARLTSLSRNTIRSWLRAPVEGEPQYRRTARPCKLTPFHDAIKQALKADALRPRSERRKALAAYFAPS